MVVEAELFDASRTEERLRRRQTNHLRRNYFRQQPVDPDRPPMAAACHFLLPWEMRYYPCLGRGLRQFAQNRVGTENSVEVA
jgi:hypothetical protein